MSSTRFVTSLILLMMLASCGLKRELQLPEHEKYKHPAPSQDATPADDSDDSDLGDDVVPVKPAPKQ